MPRRKADAAANGRATPPPDTVKGPAGKAAPDARSIAQLDARAIALAAARKVRKRLSIDVSLEVYEGLIERAETSGEDLNTVVRAAIDAGLRAIDEFPHDPFRPYARGRNRPLSPASQDPSGTQFPPPPAPSAGPVFPPGSSLPYGHYALQPPTQLPPGMSTGGGFSNVPADIGVFPSSGFGAPPMSPPPPPPPPRTTLVEPTPPAPPSRAPGSDLPPTPADRRVTATTPPGGGHEGGTDPFADDDARIARAIAESQSLIHSQAAAPLENPSYDDLMADANQKTAEDNEIAGLL